jgi:hypothetical protein
MKQIQLLIITLIIASFSFGQVAINTNGAAPHPSAILDIYSSNKGLLIPRVYLQSSVDATTIPNPAGSLLVWNSNPNMPNGVEFYYNAGSSQSPNWRPLQDLTLPFTKSTSSNGAAFTIGNYSQDPASTAIKAVGGGSGNALEVSGKLKIAGNGQAPAAGKVLTSDANGNATWEGAVAFSMVGARSDAAGDFAHNTERKVPFLTEVYDLANNYVDSYGTPASTFTVPVTGMYHFDVQVGWLNSSADGQYTIRLYRLRNGVQSSMAANSMHDAYFVQNSISIDVMLQAGDQVYVGAWQNSGNTQFVNWGSGDTRFSGRLVMKL